MIWAGLIFTNALEKRSKTENITNTFVAVAMETTLFNLHISHGHLEALLGKPLGGHPSAHVREPRIMHDQGVEGPRQLQLKALR